MKNIQESFKYTKSIADIISESLEDVQVDEGLKDVLNVIKAKFKQAYEYLKGVVIRSGLYYLPVDNEGNELPAITPLTAGQAYKDGAIDSSNTTIILNKEGSRIVGLNTNLNMVKKMYGKENAIQYWGSIYESIEDEIADVNEVKIAAEDPEAVYNRICDGKELQDEIKTHIKYNDLAPLLIWGAPGIGKTAIVEEVCKAVSKEVGNYNMIFKTLSDMSPDDFTLPKYVTIDGQEKATDIPKTWLPVYKPTGDPALDKELDNKLGKGLLFIDELSRATQQVLNVVLPLINEKKFGDCKLGSGWTIIAASNRKEDDTNSQTELSAALLNRFEHVFYEPTVHTWKKWAETQGYISPLLLQWLSMPESENMSGGKFFYMDPNQDREDGLTTAIMCSPREWTNAMKRLSVWDHTGNLEGFKIFDIPHHIIKRILNGFIPAQAVDAFMAFLEVIQKIGNFDKVVYEVWKTGGRGLNVDKKVINLVALPLAQLVISSHSDELPTTEEFESLCTWLAKTGSDQLASYTLDLFKQVFIRNTGIEEEILNDIMVVTAKYKAGKITDPSKVKLYQASFKKFFDYWKLNVDMINKPDSILNVPDYYKGIMIAGKTFGAIFKAAKINGKDALG